MKVLHLTHTNPNTDNRILKQLSALSKNSKYSIYCFGINISEGSSETKVNVKAEVTTIELFFKSNYIYRPIRHMLMLVELCTRFTLLSLKIRPDVIHCHDTLVLPVGVFLSKIFNSKLVYDAHELESNKNGQTKVLSYATYFLEKIFWNSIDHLISVSESIIDWYENEFGKKDNTLILNSPLLINSDNRTDNYFRMLYDIRQDELVFFYLGIFGRGRGLDYIIEAFSNSLIKSHVVFIGYGEYSERLKKIALSKKNIHVHDAIPHESVVDRVKNADYGLCLIENVSLSDYYCLPNKLFEYAFAGLPVLASKFPEITSVVTKYNLGYTCDLDVDSIINAIINIENDKTEKNNLELTEIGWQAQENRLVKTYNNLT